MGQPLSMTRVDPVGLFKGSGLLLLPPFFPSTQGCAGLGIPGANLCLRMSPATSSPVLQEWTGQENWSPGMAASAEFSLRHLRSVQSCCFPICILCLGFLFSSRTLSLHLLCPSPSPSFQVQPHTHTKTSSGPNPAGPSPTLEPPMASPDPRTYWGLVIPAAPP